MVRVGIVGIGFGQHIHVPAFRADSRVTVDAICASTLDRARAVAERLTIPRAYGDWRELVADGAIDAIAVSVPATLQPAIAVAAANAGKHLFLEKPLALDTAGAVGIAEAVAKAGVVAVVDFEFREVPAWRRACELLAEGAIGSLRRIHVAWHVETAANRLAKPSWKLSSDQGGGTLNLFVSHTLDSVRWFGGPITRVAGRLAPSVNHDRSVDAWLELESGVHVTITASDNSPGATVHRFELQGDAGALVLENRSVDHLAGFTLERSTREGRETIPVVVPTPITSDGRLPPVAALVKHFVDSIEGLPPTPDFPSLEEGVRVQRVIDLICAAHRSGTWQS